MIQTIKDLVSAKADTTVALAKEIWGYAELSYEETKSAAALISALKQEGFTIEEGIADIPTAFTATFTSGSAVRSTMHISMQMRPTCGARLPCSSTSPLPERLRSSPSA